MGGSVTRSGAGWRFVLDLGVDGTGKRRQLPRRGFGTKREAQAAMVETQSQVLRGEVAKPRRRTLADYAEQWLDAVQASLEPAAWTNYRTCLRLYVLPRLGHVRLSSLTPLTLSSLYAELLRSGVGLRPAGAPRRSMEERCTPSSTPERALVDGAVRRAVSG